MLKRLFTKVAELLLPEKYGNNQTPPEDPTRALISIYHRLVQLASQIETHAEAAPYPQVRQRLQAIAEEKRESAQQLKMAVESRQVWVQQAAVSPVSGKNHWERVRHDLADQKAFEDFLALCGPRLSAEYPETAHFLLKVRANQAAHRETLAELMAVADPQATQT